MPNACRAMITLAPVVCSVSLVVKILFSFRPLSKSSVDVTGTPLTPGRSLPRASDGSARPHFRCWSSVPAAVARHALPPVKRVPREQGRHVIYRHSGCRKPAVIFRRPMLPGFGIHLHVGETGVQFGTDQMSAGGPHVVCSSELHWSKAMCTPWACKSIT